MTDKTLGDEIVILVDDRISRLPVTRIGVINKIYKENFIDINLNNEILTYVKCFGNPKFGDNCIILFMNNDFNNPIAICEDIGGGGDTPELKDYVKKEDVDLKFSLEDNGQVIIGLDIGDGF